MILNRVTKQLSLPRLISIILAAILLAACASGPFAPSAKSGVPSAFSELTKNAQWYLEQVNPGKPDEAFTWQVLASRSYLLQGQPKSAVAVFNQATPLAKTPLQQAQLQLLQAQLLQAQGNSQQALNLLGRKPSTVLDSDTERNWYRQKVVLQLDNKNTLGAVKSLVSLEPLLIDAEVVTNHKQIWSLLNTLPGASLLALEEAPAPDITTGWLRLAHIANKFGTQPNRLARLLENWKRDFPTHPALTDMPASLSNVQAGPSTGVEKVAVMLPLSGNLALQGNAIRNGMLSAYKDQQKHFALSFYDTQKQTIPTLYNQVIEEGADLIIGPLLKDRVEILSKLSPIVPILALNELDKPIISDSLFYFSLSAATDAFDTAQHLYNLGYRKPLLIAAQGRVGARSIEAFEQTWAHLSQEKPVVATFRARNEIEGLVKNALRNTPSLRAGEVVSLSNPATPARAIDVVYVVANNLETRMIKPNIDIAVNPMGSLPIFASSRSHDSTSREIMNELNGLQVADMPLMMGGFAAQRAQINQLWPQYQADELRFYAMGYDAIGLAEQLTQLRSVGGEQAGMSGQLSIDHQGKVMRKLSWATYQNGQLISQGLPVPQGEATDPTTDLSTVPAQAANPSTAPVQAVSAPAPLPQGQASNEAANRPTTPAVATPAPIPSSAGPTL